MKLQEKSLVMGLELNDLICVYDDVLPKDLCKSLISFFEDNKDKHEKINNQGCPSFTQINFTEFYKINEQSENLHKRVISKVLEYKKLYYNFIDERCFPEKNSFEQFRIKKYDTSGEQRFDTHVDVQDYASARRFLSFIFYLNDVEAGGETIFVDKAIPPKCGRVVVFPPLWMYPHKGCAPISNEKYILSAYLHYK